MKTFVLLFVACALSGLAIPLPEDLPILAAGATIDGPGVFVGLAIAGALGVLVRDGVFFGVGRLVGDKALAWPFVRRMLGESRIAKAQDLVERRGGRAILVARFLVGFRSAAFFVAGTMGIRVRDFLLWDAVGVVISVPLFLGLGLVFEQPISAAITWVLDHRMLVVALAGIAAMAWFTSEAQRRAKEAEAAEVPEVEPVPAK